MNTEYKGYLRRAAVSLVVLGLAGALVYRSHFRHDLRVNEFASWPVSLVLLLLLVPFSSFVVSRGGIPLRIHVCYGLAASLPPAMALLRWQERTYRSFEGAGVIVEALRYLWPVARLYVVLAVLATGAAWLGAFLSRKNWKGAIRHALLIAVVGRSEATASGWAWSRRAGQRSWALLLLVVLTGGVWRFAYLRYCAVPRPEDIGMAMEKTRINGRNMMSSVLTRSAFPRSDGERGYYVRVFPSAERDPIRYPVETSTDVFRLYLEWGVVPDYATFLFSAPGLERIGTDGSEILRSEHNAWCMIIDVGTDRTPSHMPVFFTRNLRLESLDGLPELTDAAPFGRRGVVVVTQEMDARILRGAEIDAYFGELREMGMTNRVLQP